MHNRLFPTQSSQLFYFPQAFAVRVSTKVAHEKQFFGKFSLKIFPFSK
jgi:hypothetical protein